MANDEQGPKSPQEIADDVDKWLRRRSAAQGGEELPELEIEGNALRLVEGFIEVFKKNPQCQEAVSENYWAKTPPREKDRFVRFSSDNRRYAVQYVPDEIGNIRLVIRRRELLGAAQDNEKERQLERNPAGYWQEGLIISLIRNRTASGNASIISYINQKEHLQDNTALVVGKAWQILEDLQKPQSPFLQGDSSRWQ